MTGRSTQTYARWSARIPDSLCYDPVMAGSAWAAGSASSASPYRAVVLRHATVVRATHWIATACFFALLLSGIEILISHPRLYWGETGNVKMRPLVSFPIPSSRPSVPTGYGYVLPDQNGWSRSLHFQAAWFLLFAGAVYVFAGFATGHFRRNLLPAPTDLSWPAVSRVVARHLRFEQPDGKEGWSYNVLQRLAYLLVVFVLFPLIAWTGLAMSPAVASAFPAAVTTLGGQQSARTIHFFVTVALVAFLAVHVAMVWLAGFRGRVRAMITGRAGARGGEKA